MALQFLDLYFFAWFKSVYMDEVDKEVTQLHVPKLSLSDKRIIMTKCVAKAWRKVTTEAQVTLLFQRLGYIPTADPGFIKVPLLPSYTFDPALAKPAVRVSCHPCELRERELMAREDT